jgi:hypothetical protein
MLVVRLSDIVCRIALSVIPAEAEIHSTRMNTENNPRDTIHEIPDTLFFIRYTQYETKADTFHFPKGLRTKVYFPRVFELPAGLDARF